MSLLRTKASFLTRSATDVVVVSALRTPIGRAYKGSLRGAYPEEMLAAVLTATRAAVPELPAAAVEDVAVGVVLSELGGSKAARMALLHAGFPAATALRTVNRACASSLEAVAAVAAQIRVGAIDVGIAAGMESMTRNYGSRAIPQDVWPELLRRRSPPDEVDDGLGRSAAKGKKEEVMGEEGAQQNHHHHHHRRNDVADCVMPMGLTAEIVARRYGITRADQDAFAVESHRRAAAARASGAFDAEIVPVTTFLPPGTDGEAPQSTTVTQDDGIREDASIEALARLRPAFVTSDTNTNTDIDIDTDNGTCTAGNSSPISDGAAATLLMSRSAANALGVSHRIMGRYVAGVTVGCAPHEMGVGPAVAVPRLLGRLGLSVHDVQRWEINEAFASQALYCLRTLGLEESWSGGGLVRVNPLGGAIALGHPLGATGARLAATLLHGLRRDARGDIGVTTLCVGTGMGHAALFVAE